MVGWAGKHGLNDAAIAGLRAADGCGGLGVARYMDHAAKSGGSNAMAMAPRPAPRRAGGIVQLPHRDLEQRRPRSFQVEARVDGRSIDFMVDTGASSIALRETRPPSSASIRRRATTPSRCRPPTASARPPGAARPRRDQRHHRPRCRSGGGARRGAVDKPARHDLPVAGEMDPRPRPAGAGTVVRSLRVDGAVSVTGALRYAPAMPGDSMFPKPKPSLTPNTYAYESEPLVKPTGFREYDARWLLGQGDQPDGRAGAGHGARHADPRDWASSPRSSPATISAAIRRR